MQNKSWLTIGMVVIILSVIVWFFSSRSASSPNNTPPPQVTDKVTDNPTPPPTQVSECTAKSFDVAAFSKLKAPVGDIVVLEVQNFGSIKVRLALADAPKASDNFKKLVAAGFYDCLSFHRIAPGFVVQGGDPNGDGTGGPGFTVPAEIKLKHKRGSLAAARLPDVVNPKKESSGSQFYIALNDLPALDGEYTVFGEVVEGMDVVDKIAAVELKQKGVPDGPPKDKVVITSAVLESAQ